MIAVMIKLGFQCPECNQPIPLGGLVETAHCDHCQSTVRPDWKKLLDFGNPGISVAKWAVERPKQPRETGAFASIQLEVTRAAPACVCRAKLPLDAIVAAVGAGATACACPACGKPVAVRAAPQHVRRHYPTIAIAAGETASAEAGAGAQPAASPHPVLFGCMNCGAPLKVDGSERSIACGSCGASNYLPDPLWLRLHPVQKRAPFWLLVSP
jgi:hypothetical protein